MERKLYEELAVAIEARRNCELTNNGEWFDKWDERIKQLRDLLPAGSGFDNGTTINTVASHANKLVLKTSFHHMQECGMYDRWTDHTIVVTPTFGGFDLRITGRNHNEIKDYIGAKFAEYLDQSVPDMV